MEFAPIVLARSFDCRAKFRSDSEILSPDRRTESDMLDYRRSPRDFYFLLAQVLPLAWFFIRFSTRSSDQSDNVILYVDTAW